MTMTTDKPPKPKQLEARKPRLKTYLKNTPYLKIDLGMFRNEVHPNTKAQTEMRKATSEENLIEERVLPINRTDTLLNGRIRN